MHAFAWNFLESPKRCSHHSWRYMPISPKVHRTYMLKNSLAPAFKTLSSLSFLMSSTLRSCFPFASASFPRRIKDFNVRHFERLSNRMHKASQGSCPTVVSYP